MFIHNLKYTIQSLLKNKTLIFWTFAFSIILSTFFYMAFSNIENDEKLQVFDIAVVDNAEFRNQEIYKETLKTLSEESKEKLFNIEYINIDDAEKALENSEIEGYILFEGETPKIVVKTTGTYQTIMKFVVDEIEQTKKVVEDLKNRNIQVIMLTGDNEKTANAIAKQLGIEKVVANVLPNQKAEEIKKLKEQGLVMMCGDGINDSVSLVTADIGVSISSGTDIAMDSAEVVLMNDNLEKIEELIEISKKTIRNIKQNLFWAFFYNICMVPIACGILQPFGITMNPMIAAFAMTISSLTVVLNALRLR